MNTPQLTGIEQISDGWIKKYVLRYEMADGSEHLYEAASRKGPDAYRALLERNARGEKPRSADAICIVAKTPRDTLVMIREFRYPLNSWCIALPAGLLDPGESIAECAARELQEETGYAPIAGTSVQPLPQAGYSSTGMSDETVHVVFVEAERTSEAHRERHELIEVFELPIANVRAFLDENELPIGTRAQLILELFAAQA
ncbi:MAG: NUDIX hydrolase [Eggerthellaceae bacterium]|nr:NUDIX hydrolase [Eggerthellaceae bacterium]